MQTMMKLVSAVMVGGLMLSTAVSAQSVEKSGSRGGSVNKSATHTPGSTTGTATKTTPNGGTVDNTYSHTAGQGGSATSTKTGANGGTVTTGGTKTVTPPPQ